MEENFENGENAVDESELAAVGDILKSFTKTIKAFGAYPKDNPMYRKFATEIFEKFDGFLSAHETLSLQVEQYSLTYEDHRVFHSEDRHFNIAFLLYVDGIRNISFNEGLELAEIEQFIDILRVAPKEENPEDDLVTILWERDLKHIEYFVPEELGDMEQAIEESLLEDEPGGEAAAGAGGAPVEGGAAAVEAPCSTAYGRASLVGGGGRASRPAMGGGISAAALSEEDIEPLRRESEELSGDRLIERMMDLLFELLNTENDPRGLDELIKNVDRGIDLMAGYGDLRGVVKVLLRLKRPLGEDAVQSDVQEVAAGTVAAAGTEENVRLLINKDSDPHLVTRYVGLLEADSVLNVIGLLGETEERKLRRLLCDALLVAAMKDLGPFAQALNDKRWFLIRNLIMILGRTGDTAAVKLMERFTHHEDKRVRAALVASLETLGSKEAIYVLMKLMGDEESYIRVAALYSLRNIGGHDIYSHVMSRVLREDFASIDFAEKQAFLEAVGETGGETALPFLAKLFRRWAIIRREQNFQTRACAAMGLGFVGTPEALGLLKKGLKSRNEVFRKACEKAVRKIEHGG